MLFIIFILFSAQKLVISFPINSEHNKYLTEVLEYIEKYGSYTNNSVGFLQTEEGISNSIKELQTFANIPATGVVDKATIEFIKTPRCGNRDNFNKSHRNKRYLLYASGWNKRHITYYIKNWSPLLDEDIVSSNIQKALDTWGKHAHLSFKRTFSEDADIIASFERGDHGDGSRFDGRGKILAHAFPPGDNIGGDIHFDSDEDWFDTKLGINEQKTDFFSVAIHELGHSLGLGHSNIKSAIMYPTYKRYDKNYQDLDNDDKLGIQELYISRYINDTDPFNTRKTERPEQPPGPPEFSPPRDYPPRRISTTTTERPIVHPRTSSPRYFPPRPPEYSPPTDYPPRRISTTTTERPIVHPRTSSPRYLPPRPPEHSPPRDNPARRKPTTTTERPIVHPRTSSPRFLPPRPPDYSPPRPFDPRRLPPRYPDYSPPRRFNPLPTSTTTTERSIINWRTLPPDYSPPRYPEYSPPRRFNPVQKTTTTTERSRTSPPRFLPPHYSPPKPFHPRQYPSVPKTTEKPIVHINDFPSRRPEFPPVSTMRPTINSNFPKHRNKTVSNKKIFYEGDSETVEEHLKHDVMFYIPGTKTPKICKGYFDAVTVFRNNIYIFKNLKVWRLTDVERVAQGYPINLHQMFPDLPSDVKKIDAAYERQDGNLILFTGKYYWISNGHRFVERGPRPITDFGFSNRVNGVDAVFPGVEEGVTYFFKNNNSWTYIESERRMYKNDEKNVAIWGILLEKLDAAIKWRDQTYFFTGEMFWKFNKRLTEHDSPLLIEEYWMGCDSQ